MAWYVSGTINEECTVVVMREENWGIESSTVETPPNYNITVNTNKKRLVAAIPTSGNGAEAYGYVTPAGFADAPPSGEFTNYIAAANEDGVVSCQGVPNGANSF